MQTFFIQKYGSSFDSKKPNLYSITNELKKKIIISFKKP